MQALYGHSKERNHCNDLAVNIDAFGKKNRWAKMLVLVSGLVSVTPGQMSSC